ncbi:MAG: bifunctional riboflavin kinase/FAD synthetase [Anaerolineales bacterium]
MLHSRSLYDLSLPASGVSIGVFDGVHRGHRYLLHHLVEGAHLENLPAVVITFHPHPAWVLGYQPDLKYLTLPDERAALLQQLGVDVVVTCPFDRELAARSALDFMRLVKKHLGVRRLWIGYDFALGHGREGNSERLRQIGEKLGYQVQVIPAAREGDEVISSSRIRQLLTQGEVAEAARALGRFYEVRGRVVRGDGRGRQINIPTANLDYPPEKLIPANGVYVCRAYVGEKRFAAVTNIGFRPTFATSTPRPLIEAHLLDFEGDLYDQELRLEFVARIRQEQRFPGPEALVNQILQDIREARRKLEDLPKWTIENKP